MQLRKKVGTAWISKASLDEMIAEAERVFPNETGGVLLGYWVHPLEEVVITAVVGPGPNAVHQGDRFVPDVRYQDEEIARHYSESGRLHTYLGDWHTHPRSEPWLSRQDRRTLWEIATHAEARAPVPLMAVLACGSPWTLEVWRATSLRLGRVRLGLRTALLQQKIFVPKETG